MSAKAEGFALLELLIVLAIIGFLIGITAFRASTIVPGSQAIDSRTEKDHVQKALWSYMVVNEVRTIPTAENVSDFSTSGPPLYPGHLKNRIPGGGRTYGWSETGTVSSSALDEALPTPVPLTDPNLIHPMLERVVDNGDGTYTAWLGYLSDAEVPVSVPIGVDNQFMFHPHDRGQPTLFGPGRHSDAFSVQFDLPLLIWKVGTRLTFIVRPS